MEKKLEVKNLQISFRTQGGNVKAVRDISFDLYKGETLAIVGESGSGKSVTSKAIIGILAGNSIVEGGEILYDGQDLLKISEDDFHKLRGDKIAMIFQDPMSSLNPIIRIGHQLTEAMILKGKTSQRNAKKNFNSKLALLNAAIDGASEDTPEKKQYNKEQCSIFDSFVIKGNELELEYNHAHASTIDLQVSINDYLFLISKKQKVDLKKSLKYVYKELDKVVHPYVVLENDALELKNSINNVLLDKENEITPQIVTELFNNVNSILDKALSRPKPDYFRLGYYIYKKPDFEFNKYPIKELNEITREFLDKDYMLNFIELGKNGIQHSHNCSIEKKKTLISVLNNLLEHFNQEVIDKKETYNLIKQVGNEVYDAIDKLEITKKSVEYSFYPSLKHAVDAYYHGVKQNPINQAKYEKKLANYEKLKENGKKPTWKVVPPVLVDLDLAKENIAKVINSLIFSLNNDITNHESFDSSKNMIELIDFLKEQASKYVYKVTHKMAKAKALKLLEEVGIPDPEIRYNQYPFEFSGGMRQRIVIAIALSANPDILICDEPTTALDVTIQSQILELINRIKQERNLSVIFITHDLGVVANMADRIAVMYAGKIVEYGTSEDIFYDPRHPYTWALLSSMPDLDTKEKLEAIPGTPPNMIYPPKGDAFAERNKYALEIDFELQPPMFEITDTHYAATWLLHPNAPKVNPPKIILDRIARMKKEVNSNEQQ